MPFTGLVDKLMYEIGSLYDAEHRLVHAQREMAARARSAELKSLLEAHVGQTGEQVDRLELIFELLERPVIRITSDAAVGIARDCEEMIVAAGDDFALLDCMIAGIQMQIENFEVTAYRIALATAGSAARNDVAELLTASLEQEQETAERVEALLPQLSPAPQSELLAA
jgi:ferritin-like metal-binding protein YciE